MSDMRTLWGHDVSGVSREESWYFFEMFLQLITSPFLDLQSSVLPQYHTEFSLWHFVTSIKIPPQKTSVIIY